MTRGIPTRNVRIAAVAALSVGLVASGCSKAGVSSNSSPTTGGSSAVTPQLTGSVDFNDANLAKIDAKIKAAIKGKSLSAVKLAMVINAPSAYWQAGQKGMQTAAKELGVQSTFQAPSKGTVDQQNKILGTLRSQGVSGYSISAIDPAALKGPINKDVAAGINVLAIDSPLPADVNAPLYLGTPNIEAGKKAGEAMKTLLGGKGDVVISTGSLTALNATQRIQGFKSAIKGTNIKVVQTVNDNVDPTKAQSNAQTALQANPNVAGIWGVYSYNGPAVAQAVKSAGKAGKIKIVSDDGEPQTLTGLKSGLIQAAILQRPYQQGYTGTYLLTALKVLGKAKTMAILKPYLSSANGTDTLSSGIGLVTKSNFAAYQAKLAKDGLSSQ